MLESTERSSSVAVSLIYLGKSQSNWKNNRKNTGNSPDTQKPSKAVTLEMEPLGH